MLNMPSSTSASEALRFAIRASACAGLIALLAAAAMQWGPPAAPSNYMRATVLKNNRLLRAGSPKVILIGGSNLAFGVDSDRLGEALCRPVVNMGLTAVLGFRFIVEEADQAIGEGDLVIVAVEQSSYECADPDLDALATVLDYRRESFALIPPARRPRLWLSLGVLHLQSLAEHAWHWVAMGGPPHYADRRWLPNGDLVTDHLTAIMPADAPAPQEYASLEIDPQFWVIAADLERRAARKGAAVVYSFAPLAERAYHPDDMERLTRELAVHGHRVVGRAADHVYADSLFFDSWHHLRAPGRRLRTERLIEEVCTARPGECCDLSRPRE
jgi:hypothetical protein